MPVTAGYTFCGGQNTGKPSSSEKWRTSLDTPVCSSGEKNLGSCCSFAPFSFRRSRRSGFVNQRLPCSLFRFKSCFFSSVSRTFSKTDETQTIQRKSSPEHSPSFLPSLLPFLRAHWNATRKRTTENKESFSFFSWFSAIPFSYIF